MESSGLWIDPFLESVVFPEQFLSHCSKVLSIGQSCTKSSLNTILAWQFTRYEKKQKKSSKALLYVWPYNLLEKSQIFAFVREHHMQKYFPVAELRPYTIARNFQSEQEYVKHNYTLKIRIFLCLTVIC